MTCPFQNGSACTSNCALRTGQKCAITSLATQSAITNQKLANIESELYAIKNRLSQMR